MNTRPDNDWSDLQAMWAEQPVPDIEKYRRGIHRATIWLYVIHVLDILATLLMTAFGIFVVGKANGFAGVLVGGTLIIGSWALMVFVHRYRRSMWNAPQGSTRSLLEFSLNRARRNMLFVRLSPVLAAISFPLGVLSAAVTRDEPYTTPLLQRLLAYGLGLVVFTGLVWGICWFIGRRYRRYIHRVEGILETLDLD